MDLISMVAALLIASPESVGCKVEVDERGDRTEILRTCPDKYRRIVCTDFGGGDYQCGIEAYSDGELNLKVAASNLDRVAVDRSKTHYMGCHGATPELDDLHCRKPDRKVQDSLNGGAADACEVESWKPRTLGYAIAVDGHATCRYGNVGGIVYGEGRKYLDVLDGRIENYRLTDVHSTGYISLGEISGISWSVTSD